MMVGALLVIAGSIYIVLGALHAVFTLMDERKPLRLAPDDPAVTAAMQISKVRLSRGVTTMWQAWISFNLTHSMAAIMFGAGCVVVAAWLGVMAFPPWVLYLLAGISALFALIGLRYWFGVPRAGTLIATGCLLLAAVLYGYPWEF
jgi:hypothetical protein